MFNVIKTEGRAGAVSFPVRMAALFKRRYS